MNIAVDLQNEFDFPNIPTLKQFQLWTNAVFDHVIDRISERVDEVCIRIVDRTESARLNETFRQQTGPTNILSFSNEDENETSLGDIAICAELVEEEATDFNIPAHDHWAHLTIHGILHLLQYDHTEEQEANEMESMEVQILESLKIENPYH